jgi:hypothetical protein
VIEPLPPERSSVPALRDELRSLNPTRVAVSPPAVGGLAAGAILAAVAGLPAIAVGVVAAAGWLCGAAASSVRRLAARRRLPTVETGAARPNPYAVPQPWRDLVADVLRSQQRFAQTAAASKDGPLRFQLERLSRRLDDGVRECWAIAQRGAGLAKAVDRLDPGEIHRRLTLVEDQRAKAEAGSASAARLEKTAEAVRAQLESVERIQAVAEDTRSRLQLLAARLGEAVAGAVELSVGQGQVVEFDTLATSVDAVVGELEALRMAVADTEVAEPPPD